MLLKRVFAIVTLFALFVALFFVGQASQAQGSGEPPKATPEAENITKDALTWQINLPMMLGDFPAPPTLNLYSTGDIPSLDPQIAEDALSMNAIENLFVQLVNYDGAKGKYVPEAAKRWYTTAGSQVYHFILRTDIPWVYDNPLTGEVTQVADGEGNPRFVTANDFVYSIKRMCMPDSTSYYAGVIAPLIKGCMDVREYPDPNDIPQSLIDAIGVKAEGDDHLIIELTEPAGYFLGMTAMAPFSAVPEWTIEENGDRWTEAGVIVTDGRYTLHEWLHNVRRRLVRNPLLPQDLRGAGNIHEIEVVVLPDTSAGYDQWLHNQVDISGIPSDKLDFQLSNFPDETIKVSDLSVFYFGFRTTKTPFDDPRVRRAFSAAFDREKFVTERRHGGGYPMKHFAPPGIFGAPPIDEVGVGYDPAFARSQLAAAGYPNCDGLPTVTILGYSGGATLRWLEYARQQWVDNLGCSPESIQLEQDSFHNLLQRTDPSVPDDQAPHMWTLGWGPDYPDENNWVGDVLWCGHPTRDKRACSHTDDLIVQARREANPDVRIALYRQIEDAFFGKDGEMPIAPLYVRESYSAQHSWLTAPRALFGGNHYYDWRIDALEKYYKTH